MISIPSLYRFYPKREAAKTNKERWRRFMLMQVNLNRVLDFRDRLGLYPPPTCGVCISDGSPTGGDAKQLHGAATTARPDEGGGCPTPSHFPLPLEEKQ